MSSWTSYGLERCCNLTCPNRASEGRFQLVESREPIVSGVRQILLLLCAPCASAMGEALS